MRCERLSSGVFRTAWHRTSTAPTPALRCARARHFGSREFNTTAFELYTKWLPTSGETLGSFPWFFHYVNVGPNVQTHEMITDVYLPLR